MKKTSTLITEEIVDIVDEHDRILYQTSKTDAHQKGLLHRTVVAAIINSSGAYTLIRPASDKQDAGQWVSPIGGHVSAGESEEAALKRESLEEAGLDNFRFLFKGKAIFDRKVLGRHENHYLIIFEIYSNEKPALNHESAEYKTFSQAELKTQLRDNPQQFGDAFLFVLRKFYPQLLGA